MAIVVAVSSLPALVGRRCGQNTGTKIQNSASKHSASPATVKNKTADISFDWGIGSTAFASSSSSRISAPPVVRTGFFRMESLRTGASSTGAANAVKAEQIRVLFVCLGNICRSPTAEAVFRTVVEKRGLTDYFDIDSAGMIDYHEGGPADARMKDHAKRRGIILTSISRPVVKADLDSFDLILAMDNQNREDLLKAYRKWNSPLISPEFLGKVKMMCEFCRTFPEKEVPDPYYGGPAGFEKVLDMLEDACEGLLDSLEPRIKRN